MHAARHMRRARPDKREIAPKRALISLEMFDHATIEEAKKVIRGESEAFHFDTEGNLIQHEAMDDAAIPLFDDAGKKLIDYGDHDTWDAADAHNNTKIEIMPHAQNVMLCVAALLFNKEAGNPFAVSASDVALDMKAGVPVDRGYYQIHTNPRMRMFSENKSPVAAHLRLMAFAEQHPDAGDGIRTIDQNKRFLDMQADEVQLWSAISQEDRDELQQYHELREEDAMGQLERGLTEKLMECSEEELDDMDPTERMEYELYTPERVQQMHHRAAADLLLDNKMPWATGPITRFHNSHPEAVKYLLQVEAEDFYLDRNGKVTRINNIPAFIDQHRDQPLGHLELKAAPALIKALQAELSGQTRAHS